MRGFLCAAQRGDCVRTHIRRYANAVNMDDGGFSHSSRHGE